MTHPRFVSVIAEATVAFLVGALLFMPVARLHAESAKPAGDHRVFDEILAKRPKPLTELRVKKTFNVSDFGAMPDSKENALPAIRKAIASAMAAGQPSAVVFPKGTYYLNLPENGDRACFPITDASNLVLDGSDSELILQNPRHGFIALSKCKNVIIRNFVIDYAPLPFTQGIVQAVHPNDGTFDVRIEPGFPPLDAPHLNYPDVGFLKDPEIPGRQKPNVSNFHAFTKIERLPDNLFEVHLQRPGQIRDFAVGDRYISIGRAHATGGIVGAELSSQITCQNITIYTSPGTSFLAWATDAFNILSCKTKILTGRWQSTNADGVHCQSNRIGPWIENCEFEGMEDDGVNVYTRSFDLKTYPADNWIRERDGYLGWKGDVITAFDPARGRMLGTVPVAASDPAGRRFQLGPSFPGALGLTNKELPVSLYNRQLQCPYTVIRNNLFRDFRGNGLLIKTIWTLIEGNRFEGVSDRAIQVVNNGGGPEGLQSEHIQIKGNQIVQCGYDGVFTYAPDSAAICVFLSNEKNGFGEWRGQRDISIEDNLIEHWQRTAISIGSAQQVSVLNNTLTNSKVWPHRSTHPDIPIRVVNSDQVEIADNTITDNRPIAKWIEADPSCGKVAVRNNIHSSPVAPTEAPIPTRSALRANAKKALDDLSANFWIGTPTGGHFDASSWGGAQAADAFYAWWKITGSTDAANRVAAHWRWLMGKFPASDLIACGAHSAQNYAQDDTAWDVGFMLQAYEVTRDPEALRIAKATLDFARGRWWDTTFGGGYWYDDSKSGKSAYQPILILDEETYYEESGDKAYLKRAMDDEAWVASHLLITPAFNSVSPAGDGLYFDGYSATGYKGGPGPDGSPYHMKVTNLAQSNTMLVANMAMAVLDWRLYKITGNQVYKSRMLATAAGIRRTETNAGNPAPGALSGVEVFTDDQDANVNGYEAIRYVLEVLPHLPEDGTYADGTVFKKTAAAIMANDRLPSGLYGGDWQGPVDGVWTNNHNHSIPQGIVVTANAINMVVAAAGIK